MTKYVEYDEPVWSNNSGEILGNSIIRMLPETAIVWWKESHPDHEWTDEQALDHFMVINWAVFKEYPDA